MYSHHDAAAQVRKNFSQKQKHFWFVITSIAQRHIYVTVKILEKKTQRHVVKLPFFKIRNIVTLFFCISTWKQNWLTVSIVDEVHNQRQKKKKNNMTLIKKKKKINRDLVYGILIWTNEAAHEFLAILLHVQKWYPVIF